MAVRSLHTALQTGRSGAFVVGLLGLGLIIEAATGLWLYGPFVARRMPGRSRAIHRIVGGGSLAVAAVVGVTGALLALAPVMSVMPGPGGRLARLDFVAAHVPAGDAIIAFVAEPGHRVRVETRRPDGGLRSLLPAPPVAAWCSLNRVSPEAR